MTTLHRTNLCVRTCGDARILGLSFMQSASAPVATEPGPARLGGDRTLDLRRAVGCDVTRPVQCRRTKGAVEARGGLREKVGIANISLRDEKAQKCKGGNSSARFTPLFLHCKLQRYTISSHVLHPYY